MNNARTVYKVGGEGYIELGRMSWKGSAGRMYVPQRVCKSMALTRDSKSLILFYDEQTGVLFAWADKALERKLRPVLLESRRKITEIIKDAREEGTK